MQDNITKYIPTFSLPRATVLAVGVFAFLKGYISKEQLLLLFVNYFILEKIGVTQHIHQRFFAQPQQHLIPDGTRTLPEFIEYALYDPRVGYYSTGRVNFGPDFVTYAVKWAPLLAEKFFLSWKIMVKKNEINPNATFYLFEFGAGTGEMALTLLKYIHGCSLLHKDEDPQWVDFYHAIKYVVCEFSPALHKKQKEKLNGYAERDKVEFYQTDARKVDDTQLPCGPGIVVSNELIDAFPAHKITLRLNQVPTATVIKTEKGKHSVIEKSAQQVLNPEEFEFLNRLLKTVAPLFNKLHKQKDTIVFYLHPAIENYYKKLARCLTKGYVFTLDYGKCGLDYFMNPDGALGIRTFPKKTASFLDDIGKQDITTDVNFSDLAQSGQAHGFDCSHFDIQSVLLRGPDVGQFQVLVQERGLSPECSQLLFCNTKTGSPIFYEDMLAVSELREKGEALLQKVNVNKSSLKIFLDFLIEHHYATRDRSFIFSLDDAFSTFIVKELLQNPLSDFDELSKHKKYAELFITALMPCMYRMVETQQQAEAIQKIYELTRLLFEKIYTAHPELKKIVGDHLATIHAFNFIDAEDKSNSRLTLCLRAADSATVKNSASPF